MAEAVHPPSPSTVGAIAWLCVGLYLLLVIGWEWRKVVRQARRERVLTEEASEAARGTDD